MNHNPDIVDKAIEAMKKERAASPLSENTIDTTKALLAEEQEKNKTKPRKKTNIIKKLTSAEHLAKTAIAAAVLLAAILTIALVLTNNKKPQTPTAQKINLDESQETKTTQDSEQTLQRQLQNIRQMVAEGDIDGLLDMLRNGQEETKVAAAYYLGQIGDLNSVSALKQESKKNAPKDPNNPFEKAARQIIKRSGLEEFIASLTPEEKINLRRELFTPKGIVSGLVLDAQTSEPIEDAELAITKRKIYTTRTDANGFYHFDQIEEPGNYRISIWSDLYVGIYEPDKEPVIDLTNKTRTVKHFNLKPACMLQVLVLNDQNEPVEDVAIIATFPADKHPGEIGNRLHSQKTDANGLMLLGGFEPSNEPYLITAIPPGKKSRDKDANSLQEQKGYTAANLTVTLTNPDVIEHRKIILKKGLAVRGYVYDSQGLPRQGVTLFFQNAAGRNEQTERLATAVTDSNGFYRVTNLPEKICYIRRTDAATHLGVVKRTFLPTSGQTTKIDFGGQPVITGRLVIDAEPLANTKMLLAGSNNAQSEIFSCFALTDQQGRFSFAGATPGRHAVYYQAPQERNLWLKAANIEVAAENIELGIIPELSSNISVYIENDTNDPNLASSQVFLQEDTNSRGQRVGLINNPAAPNEPYTITKIPPGQYTLVAVRTDNVIIRQQIEVTEKQHNAEMNIAGTCTLTGNISGKLKQAAIWRKDKKVFALARPDTDGKFKIENLPDGQYSVGTNMMLDVTTWFSFNLAKRETKSVDIDTDDFAKPSLATLRLQVLTENGIPVPGTDAWLERDDTVIEPVNETRGELFFLTEPGIYTIHAIYPAYREYTEPVLLEQIDWNKPNAIPLKFIRLNSR